MDTLKYTPSSIHESSRGVRPSLAALDLAHGGVFALDLADIDTGLAGTSENIHTSLLLSGKRRFKSLLLLKRKNCIKLVLNKKPLLHHFNIYRYLAAEN